MSSLPRQLVSPKFDEGGSVATVDTIYADFYYLLTANYQLPLGFAIAKQYFRPTMLGRFMQWVAALEKDTTTDTLEKRLRAVVV